MSGKRMQGSKTIKKDRTSILLSLTKEDRAKLEAIADQEDRSMSNMASFIIKKWLDAQV